ncbi:MAG: zf-HC2 domain-containing protein [Anaerolineales bacterium]|nr:zf-HC2 domain-containing protein [Anaerolineales bacterium]
MNHITEELLNEYLDQALDQAAAGSIDRHLQSCRVCTARMQGLQRLFEELAALPEEPLTRDLAPGILARLRPQPAFSFGKLLLLGQAGTALTILVLLAHNIPDNLNLGGFWHNAPGKLPDIQTFLLQAWLLASRIQLPSVEFPTLPAPWLQTGLDSSSISLILASTAALWVVGNLLLLNKTPPASGNTRHEKSS